MDRIGVQIHRAHQAYTEARVEACNRVDLDGSQEVRYPVEVYLGDEQGGGMEIGDTSDEDFDDSVQLAKFYSLTTTVLDNISSTAGMVAYPVVISAEEAAVVDHFLTPAFILGRSGTGKTTCLVYKLAGRYINSTENGAPLRQILLTRSGRLASKLRANTDGLIEARLGERKRPPGVNYAKNDDFDGNTRKQLSSLTDTDFPLVCTFDHLLKLIENSIREQEILQRYIKIDNFRRGGVIDFMKFSIEYWAQLSPKLKKGIPVELAFLEIMGVIKGSASQATGFEPLSREQYLRKRWRLAPNFASDMERNTVYDIYEWYERTKGKRGNIDQADRIIRVMGALEAFGSSEIFGILDEIYVDEIQDHRASEIGMLLSLVGSPLGIHFAGDTAQCISKDALFRFANAKYLFYERFKDGSCSDIERKPRLLPLSHNFRSHKEILRVASLVMHLLYGGFPDLVDNLPPEIGDIPGPKPTLYIGNNITDILKFEEGMEKLLKSDGRSNKFNEYGEVRVILVRDEETRDRLQAELGRSSLVLTIIQSKGMEFEDVFLYDFLSTSPYSHKLNILEEVFRWSHHADFSPGDYFGPGGEGSGYNTSTYLGSHVVWAKNNIVLCSELKVF
ncbi:P-loop containing nucleoside triphosphate hydrolase protein [Tuber indicum]|nr:P-loop containing nucleoside triphosphate hydrolase protein [Tuber indicum]